MKILLRTLIGSTLLTLSLWAADITGTWKASLVDPKDVRQPVPSPVPFSPVFEFKTEGRKVSGIAHLGIWLGDAEILDGKVEGDNISFVTVAETKSTLGRLISKWTGTLRGDRLELTMHYPREADELKLTASKIQ